MVKRLLAHPMIELDPTDSQGKTPLQIAKELKATEIIWLFCLEIIRRLATFKCFDDCRFL